MKKLSFITRISFLLAAFFTIDKGLAFLKVMLFNKVVGLEGMGIFGAANNLPDYLSALLSGGALGIAFIPVLTEYIDRDGREAAWDLFSRVINLAFLVTAAVSIVIISLAGPLVRTVIAPHFSPANQALTASLMRFDLIAILIFSISGLVMSGLQANQHFLLPALAPVLYNCGQIFGATILAPSTGFHIGPHPAAGLQSGVVRDGLWGHSGGGSAPAHPGAGIASVPVPLAARHRLKKSWRYADHNPVVAACPDHGLHPGLFRCAR